MVARDQFFSASGLGFVIPFGTIPLRHPNGFRRFALWSRAFKINQIALRALHTLKDASDGGAASLSSSLGSQFCAQNQRQSTDFSNSFNPLTINGFQTAAYLETPGSPRFTRSLERDSASKIQTEAP